MANGIAPATGAGRNGGVKENKNKNKSNKVLSLSVCDLSLSLFSLSLFSLLSLVSLSCLFYLPDENPPPCLPLFSLSSRSLSPPLSLFLARSFAVRGRVLTGMKLLEDLDLTRLGATISGAHDGERIRCRLEVYSCKMAGDDKKLYKMLAAEQGGSLAAAELLSPSPLSPPGFSMTAPLEPVPCTQKMLYYLKATLNASYSPEYDFSCVPAVCLAHPFLLLCMLGITSLGRPKRLLLQQCAGLRVCP
ncbi:uncharacterized protein MONBRDRAFT_24678 [Monosiga brevicollis MX1]|uniref:Uncharacterized protein n=1 Tax=Monosiga brevicollis TaxID=81824 RepID=A9UX54_MONBE|nr:uncharacterized protein MONBRDRAFT_24678 [Monosiga brevicollis MX1]EDQ90157.1 predicted protein [Monosiga brevicollis MX1]|eukprot:XP_001744924.1 hypothetical protein [Monosiga brevicollis MX1]